MNFKKGKSIKYKIRLFFINLKQRLKVIVIIPYYFERCKFLEKQEKLQFELVKEIHNKCDILKREKENLRIKIQDISRKQKQLEE